MEEKLLCDQPFFVIMFKTQDYPKTNENGGRNAKTDKNCDWYSVEVGLLKTSERIWKHFQWTWKQLQLKNQSWKRRLVYLPSTFEKFSRIKKTCIMINEINVNNRRGSVDDVIQRCGLCSLLSSLLRRAMCVGSRRGSGESYYQELAETAVSF